MQKVPRRVGKKCVKWRTTGPIGFSRVEAAYLIAELALAVSGTQMKKWRGTRRCELPRHC